MKFSVVIQPPAEADAEEAYLYILGHAPAAADAWLDGLLAVVETLATLPERCPLAPENDAFEEEIRQLLYRSHRVLFTVQGDRVHVLHGSSCCGICPAARAAAWRTPRAEVRIAAESLDEEDPGELGELEHLPQPLLGGRAAQHLDVPPVARRSFTARTPAAPSAPPPPPVGPPRAGSRAPARPTP